MRGHYTLHDISLTISGDNVACSIIFILNLSMSLLQPLSFPRKVFARTLKSVLSSYFFLVLLISWVEVFVLQELFAVQSSSGDTDSSLEILHCSLTVL